VAPIDAPVQAILDVPVGIVPEKGVVLVSAARTAARGRTLRFGTLALRCVALRCDALRCVAFVRV
jgi:hypothetical protein